MEAMSSRRATYSRKTKETRIELSLDLEGSGKCELKTGLPFFEHMLDCLCRQALFDLKVRSQGDLEVDDHHLVEDLGLALGEALSKALGDKSGIRRYGSAMAPLDEALVAAAVDCSGRPYLRYALELPSKAIKGFELQLLEEFCRAFCDRARLSVHLEQRSGKNAHHIVEAAFKAFGLALRQACERDPRRKGSASTKGSLAL